MITDFRINAKGELEGKVIPPAKWEEMYTKDEVVAMLKEIRVEMEHVEPRDIGESIVRNACRQVIDIRINALKEREDGK